MALKEELLVEAEDLGIDTSDDPTKDVLEERIAAHRQALSALGPAAPLGQDDDAGFKPQSNPNKGIQPLTYDDVPEALR